MINKPLRIIALVGCSSIFSIPAFAQGLGLGIPTLGYVFNPGTAAIHPITGILGASALGPAVLKGLQGASCSPYGDIALVAGTDGLALVTGMSISPHYSSLTSSPPPFLAAWGKTSVVIFAEGGFRLISEFGSSPNSLTMAIGLPEGPVSAIDYDEAKQRLYIALTSGDTNGGLYVFSIPEQRLQLLVALANPVSIARAGGSVFTLDGTANTIWRVFPDGSALQLPIVGDPRTQLVAIAAASDERRLYVADAGLQQVAVFDLAGSPIAQIAANDIPTRLERLGQGSLLLGNQSGQPLWILNDSSQPAIYFVPAIPSVATSTEGSN